MKVTGPAEVLVILNQIAVFPVPGSTAKRAATSIALPALDASPMKRRRNRLGPYIEMSYLPEPLPNPMLNQSVEVAPGSTVYCQAAVSRYWCGWIEKCAARFASGPWLDIENQARILPAPPNSKRSRLPFTW